jgi:hypothetical protein
MKKDVQGGIDTIKYDYRGLPLEIKKWGRARTIGTTRRGSESSNKPAPASRRSTKTEVSLSDGIHGQQVHLIEHPN